MMKKYLLLLIFIVCLSCLIFFLFTLKKKLSYSDEAEISFKWNESESQWRFSVAPAPYYISNNGGLFTFINDEDSDIMIYPRYTFNFNREFLHIGICLNYVDSVLSYICFSSSRPIKCSFEYQGRNEFFYANKKFNLIELNFEDSFFCKNYSKDKLTLLIPLLNILENKYKEKIREYETCSKE